MRTLMLGTAALALSGCSFLGFGGQPTYPDYNPQTGYYGQPVVSAATPRCHSGNCLSRVNLEGGIGPVFHAGGGNIVTSGRTNNLDGTDYNSLSFNDVYDTGVRGELGGSYALAPNTKVSLLGHYERAESDGVQDWGTIDGQQLTGALTDYESYGAELGLRQYFQPANGIILDSVRPYFEGRVGVSRVEDIAITGAQLGDTAVANGADIGFYDNSWVPTGAALIGLETPVARYFTMGVETGVRVQGGLKSDNDVLVPGSTLSGLNNNQSRVSIPLTLRGRYRF